MVPAPSEQHGDVRRLVLDAAVAIIELEGAESLSMREVARRAGVSHQAPYHYFSDRSGIFAAISEEGFAGLAQAFRDVHETEMPAAKAGFTPGTGGSEARCSISASRLRTAWRHSTGWPSRVTGRDDILPSLSVKGS